MISLLARFSVDEIQDLSDMDLRIAIAKEYRRYDEIYVHPSGAIEGNRDGVFTMRPSLVPDWPNDLTAVAGLENDLQEDGFWTEYLKQLEAIGCDKFFSPRKRCEAVLATVRAAKN
jgi:hypothetical protein